MIGNYTHRDRWLTVRPHEHLVRACPLELSLSFPVHLQVSSLGILSLSQAASLTSAWATRTAPSSSRTSATRGLTAPHTIQIWIWWACPAPCTRRAGPLPPPFHPSHRTAQVHSEMRYLGFHQYDKDVGTKDKYYEYLRWSPRVIEVVDWLSGKLFNGSSYVASHIRVADAHWEHSDCKHTIAGVPVPCFPPTLSSSRLLCPSHS